MISSRIVKSQAPDLLPIFRSDEQARLLSEIFLNAPEGSSLAALARATGISPSGVHKEIERLERAGIVASERIGRSRIVRPNDASPFYRELRSLLMKAFGPAPRLRSALAAVDGIDDAFIFGSWARAVEGDLERPPRDIDVMVVGTVDLDVLYEHLRAVESDLGRPLNLTVYTRDEWDADERGFARQVRAQPRIDLGGSADD